MTRAILPPCPAVDSEKPPPPPALNHQHFPKTVSTTLLTPETRNLGASRRNDLTSLPWLPSLSSAWPTCPSVQVGSCSSLPLLLPSANTLSSQVSSSCPGVLVVQSLGCVQFFVTPWSAARRFPYPSLTLGVYSKSCPLSR